MTAESKPQTELLIKLTADVVAAYVSNNSVPAAELPGLIGNVHASLQRVQGGVAVEEAAPARQPAVPIKKSVTPDFIISLEDGKKFKSLKRHLATHYKLSPEEYRVDFHSEVSRDFHRELSHF